MTVISDNKLIIEAYARVISEAKESKFKVGDRVGVGSHSSWGDWNAHDTGTVTKVNGHGHTTVQFDKRKSADNPESPYHEVFDHAGYSKKQYSSQRLVPIEQHERAIKARNDHAERSADFGKISELISGHRNGFGQYSRLSKDHADLIKSIVDKHTEFEVK